MRGRAASLARAWRESPCLCLGLLAVLGLRLGAIWWVPVDSDETQHLHVVWWWSQGWLPYRDMFDNHMPLYQWLCRPLLAALGERDDVLLWMRLAQWPLNVLALGLLLALGKRLWGIRVALAAALLASLWPSYYGQLPQFRPDHLWAVSWLAAIYLGTGPGAPWRRAAACGLCVGIAFASSMKTSLLLACALLTLLALLPACYRQQRAWQWRRWTGMLALGAAMAALPVLAVVAYIQFHGIGAQAWYGIVQHNLVAHLGRWQSHGLLRPLLLPLALLILARWAWRHVAASPQPWLSIRRCFVAGFAPVYLAALYGYWPLVPTEHLLPSTPLLALGVAAYLDRRGRAGPSSRRWLPCLLALECGGLLVAAAQPGLSMADYRGELATLAQLTRADDSVMDAKGESIFHRRPYFYVMEGITKQRIMQGSIINDIPQRMIAAHTAVVIPQGLLPWTSPFLADNYLMVAPRLALLGQRFDAGPAGCVIKLSVPSEYALIDSHGTSVQASVDGHPYRGPLWLAAGAHRLVVEQSGSYALVWAPALRRGLAATAFFSARPWPWHDGGAGWRAPWRCQPKA